MRPIGLSPLATAAAAARPGTAARSRAAGPRTRKPRIEAIDAARGCAMILVFASHIKQHFLQTSPDVYLALLNVTRIATPTFLLLSGFVIGHLLRNDSRGHVGIAL